MLEVRKSMLYPTFKPSRANTRYGSKTGGKREVLTGALPPWLPFHGLIVESQVVTPTLNWDYFIDDTRIGVSCVQGYVEAEPEGTPAHWDSYSFAEPFAGSNAAGVAVLYS
jgi:hypothetical protein